jgi:hypothetical protein
MPVAAHSAPLGDYSAGGGITESALTVTVGSASYNPLTALDLNKLCYSTTNTPIFVSSNT